MLLSVEIEFAFEAFLLPSSHFVLAEIVLSFSYVSELFFCCKVNDDIILEGCSIVLARLFFFHLTIFNK